MYSGTFGRGLIAFAQSLVALAEDVKALLESEIYQQRLIRCLTQYNNRKALGDFLALDNICRDLQGLVGGDEAAVLREARKNVFSAAYTAVGNRYSYSAERRQLRDHLLDLRPSRRTPEAVWEQLGWE